MSIIAISGKIGSGKDTVGNIILDLTKKHRFNNHNLPPNWSIKKFATKLKQHAANILGISPDRFEDAEFKNSKMGEEWAYYRLVGQPINGITREYHKVFNKSTAFKLSQTFSMAKEKVIPTYREFLQDLGNTSRQIHENIWLNALFSTYRPEPLVRYHADEVKYEIPESNWIITDLRYKNEYQTIKEKNGLLIRIEREGLEGSSHISETDLDDLEFDYTIANNQGIEELTIWVRDILEAEGIIDRVK